MDESQAKIESVRARAYRIPTDRPEADGTLEWDSTTLVMVQLVAGRLTGLGYTYADSCITGLIEGPLARAIQRRDVLDVPGCWRAMQGAVRNLGREGLAAMAISAVDVALWDLKAKLLHLSLGTAAGPLSGRGPHLRERGLHELFRCATARTVKRLG